MADFSTDASATRPSPALREATRPHRHQTATSLRFQDVVTWLRQAEAARTLPEMLAYLSQALLFNPTHPLARQRMYHALQRLLQRDAFLAYVDENEGVYQVHTASGQSLVVPKDRAISLPYPPKQRSLLQWAYRWLGWALLGLLPAGLGTLVCAPVAAILALLAWQRPLDQADITRSIIIMLSAAVLWFGALPLYIILVLHLI